MMRKEVVDALVAGAIFDFMGYLATRDKKLTLSSSDDYSPAIDAIKEFMAMRNIDGSLAMVDTWDKINKTRYQDKNK